MKHSRVRQAYKEKEASMLSILGEKNVERDRLQIYLRAFKREKELELWGKNRSDDTFRLLKTYKICRTSGKTGPKRKQGDRQIPEGYYYINRFNPTSNYYLSLGINYPNPSDRILGEKGNLGGDIFIHGKCVTIGCLPITDTQIKELYVFCVEARDNGEDRIPVTIFPTRLTDAAFRRLCDSFSSDTDKTGLWTDLKKGFDLFNVSKQVPEVEFMRNGRHIVKE